MLRAPQADPCVWAVFPTHREACAALSLSAHLAPALEDDLEPFSKLKRLDLPLQPRTLVGSASSMVSEDYSLSSNPPSPRTSFRLGDWICRSPKCAAHNFGRNLTCIGCGCPRSPTNGSAASGNDTPPAQSPHHQQHFALQAPPRPQLSPRFASNNSMQQYPSNSTYGYPSPCASQQGYVQQPVVNLPAPSSPSTANIGMPAHPLLTPSGRAFARGGKVQNISRDPLSPCIMYWPDNEPFPEQGQIRPSGLMGIPQPPILNTGNRGPISHQPGDWICLKCNYLNWRRRKVCQTCLPYAEGNGDSISAAVQAERIALLTSVLTQTHISSPSTSPSPSYPPVGRSHSTAPAQPHRPFVNFSPPPAPRLPVHRSQSHNELGSQYNQGYPIYQTAPQRQYYPSPLHRSAEASPTDVYAPAPLLPSFLLQDVVHSPTLSPASTSSADLSFEEYEDSLPSSTRSTFSSGADSVNTSPLANIWRLDGEESKSLSGFHLASATSSRNSSVERLGLHVSSS
ncbi:hypothetical protein FB45DRAFT_158454 [Roridomyces roridus]|uniref:RanBP2-type domain-containing protein n=1 Tax=Roridomyces roridus TaxID=1738132 RepID=A0AAD7BFV1_9AGAR|nr:hypothetical protein FB45DRAFT_158454 [Roridomyces roridus]